MKSISITFHAPGLTIPLNYHHGVQSMIYSVLRDAGDSGDRWHDNSVDYGRRRYKLFTFSSLRGKKNIANGEMTFDSLIYLDIRGVRNDFCAELISAFGRRSDLTLYGSPLTVQSVKYSSPQILTNRVNIKMLSPLTVHKTEGKKTSYCLPADPDFARQVSENFRRKYTAFTGQEPAGGIKLTPRRIGAKDKYVTTFKGIHITAWRGEYALSGQPEHLNFLYYCGLGARNSDGFGLFETI